MGGGGGVGEKRRRGEKGKKESGRGNWEVGLITHSFFLLPILFKKRQGTLPGEGRGFFIVLWTVGFEEPVVGVGVDVEVAVLNGQVLHHFQWFEIVIIGKMAEEGGGDIGDAHVAAPVEEGDRVEGVRLEVVQQQGIRGPEGEPKNAKGFAFRGGMMLEEVQRGEGGGFGRGKVCIFDKRVGGFNRVRSLAEEQIRGKGHVPFGGKLIAQTGKNRGQAPPRMEDENRPAVWILGKGKVAGAGVAFG